MNNFCSIGLKILAAAGIGVAVYFGLDKIGNAKNNNQKPNQPNPQPQPQRNNYEEINNTQVCCVEEVKPVTKVEKVVDGLKTAQDICGRGFSLCQNLVMMIDNVSKIFGRNNYDQGYYQGNGFGGAGVGYGYNNQAPGNGYQDKYKDPPGFRRISPFILEFVGKPGEYNTPNYNYQPQPGQYPGGGF